MKAMIFAAGLGTRLKPYTENLPKALVPVAGKPMIEHVILRLKQFGIEEIIVNVHHFADQVIDFLEQNKNFGIGIEISNESGQLLETGGGLWKASWFFNDGAPFLVHNVDIFSEIDLAEMLVYHRHHEALASLAVSSRETSRYFLFDSTFRLYGWENIAKMEQMLIGMSRDELTRMAFSGIQILDPRIFSLLNKKGRFSLVDVYLELAGANKILGFPHDPNTWVDMGKPADILKAETMINQSFSAD
ncbi:MAG: nucleotidyltransferase family protein [Bacteroidetes bacterium]|nr:nucleotidyltransferase family protein [Bacteroidota bacterium]